MPPKGNKGKKNQHGNNSGEMGKKSSTPSTSQPAPPQKQTNSSSTPIEQQVEPELSIPVKQSEHQDPSPSVMEVQEQLPVAPAAAQQQKQQQEEEQQEVELPLSVPKEEEPKKTEEEETEKVVVSDPVPTVLKAEDQVEQQPENTSQQQPEQPTSAAKVSTPSSTSGVKAFTETISMTEITFHPSSQYQVPQQHIEGHHHLSSSSLPIAKSSSLEDDSLIWKIVTDANPLEEDSVAVLDHLIHAEKSHDQGGMEGLVDMIEFQIITFSHQLHAFTPIVLEIDAISQFLKRWLATHTTLPSLALTLGGLLFLVWGFSWQVGFALTWQCLRLYFLLFFLWPVRLFFAVVRRLGLIAMHAVDVTLGEQNLQINLTPLSAETPLSTSQDSTQRKTSFPF
eukprot:scaffold1729_cov173-Ochromonas_danica.AAC.9